MVWTRIGSAVVKSLLPYNLYAISYLRASKFVKIFMSKFVNFPP